MLKQGRWLSKVQTKFNSAIGHFSKPHQQVCRPWSRNAAELRHDSVPVSFKSIASKSHRVSVSVLAHSNLCFLPHRRQDSSAKFHYATTTGFITRSTAGTYILLRTRTLSHPVYRLHCKGVGQCQSLPFAPRVFFCSECSNFDKTSFRFLSYCEKRGNGHFDILLRNMETNPLPQRCSNGDCQCHVTRCVREISLRMNELFLFHALHLACASFCSPSMFAAVVIQLRISSLIGFPS